MRTCEICLTGFAYHSIRRIGYKEGAFVYGPERYLCAGCYQTMEQLSEHLIGRSWREQKG